MTKGVILFAHNNGEIDYIKLAKFAAKRVKKCLNLPVSLITDKKTKITGLKKIFDKIIFTDTDIESRRYFYDGVDQSKILTWKNGSRSNVYDLTPYEETLVLDVDYIISSKVLLSCWDRKEDFLIYRDSYDLSGWRDDSSFRSVSEYSIPFYWATVFWFRKSAEVQMFFNIVDHIKNNWHYYKILYQIHSTNFRNDHAFSIALHTMNGFTNGYFAGHLPGKMFYIYDLDFLEKIDDDDMLFLVQKKNSNNDYIFVKTHGLDVHVMNKYSLLRMIDNV